MSKASSTHEILILGGHFAGVGTAHYLLRHIVPSLSKLTPTTTYHVTIVAPHTESMFSIAGPRYLIGKDLIPADKMFIPLADGFKQYNSDQYKLVQGKATAVNADNKSVSVAIEGGATQELGYETLVVATGTTSKSALWQMNNHQDEVKELFKSVQKTLTTAKRVLIAGGGAVGVETAGEIATHYPTAGITLLSGSERLLPRLVDANSKGAEKKLKKMGVTVTHQVRVTSSKQNPDGTTALVLSDKTEQTVDLYIDATGGTPNSSFLPSTWLNEAGYVKTDETALRTEIPGVYAVGDVASYSSNSYMDVTFSVSTLATTIGVDIAAKADNTTLFKEKTFKPMKNTQLVPIGPGGGVGQAMGWKLPSTLVWLAKSRTFFIEKAEGSVTGQDYLKA